MVIERHKNEVIIRLDTIWIEIGEIQRFADYFHFLKSNAKNKGTQEEAAKVAREVHKGWWSNHRSRFIK